MAYKRCMRDIYERLRGCGFDAQFVRDVVLPDWWEDGLAENPTNRAIAEMAIARHLRVPVSALRRPGAQLALPAVSDFRLKRSKGTTPSEVRPAVMAAQRAAELIREVVAPLPTFRPGPSAKDVRRAILAAAPCAALPSLVHFAWEHGIAVAHLLRKRMPRLGKGFDGIAMFLRTGPVIILCSGRDSPPWLAFHLAHEMGHLFCGHVQPGGKPLVDSSIDGPDSSRDEEQSDQFATELLTGEKKLAFQPTYGLTAAALPAAARRYGEPRSIDPATVALIYGRSADRWGVAQAALKRMGQDQGGQAIIRQALLGHLTVADIPDSTASFLSSLSGVTL